MKCNIIRDLLPLYCDKLTSEDSNEAIREHLSECGECNEIYENMSAEGTVRLAAADKNVEPLKKVKKSFKRRTGLWVFGTVMACVLVFLFSVVGVMPISSKNLAWHAITYEDTMVNCSVDENNNIIPGTEQTETKLLIRFNIYDKNERTIRISEPKNPEVLVVDGSSYIMPEARLIPSLISKDDSWNIAVNIDPTTTESAIITIHCRDKDIKLNLNDIAKECIKNDNCITSDEYNK